MQAQDRPFTQLLEGAKQFIIPIFQRTYSWELEHCAQLWDDIVRIGVNDNLQTHFVGSVVYIPEEGVDATIPRWLVIDGQQRITTLTLLLLAFKNRVAKTGEEAPISAPEVEDRFLKNRYGKGETCYRLLPTNTDKATLIKYLDGKETDETDSNRIIENFSYFTEQIAEADLETLWKGIRKLRIVDVALQQGIDNPQMIFESMNSTAKALTQADLIRNYVLMGLEHELQTRLYLDYWRKMELEFGMENYTRHFDKFMRFYILIKTGNVRIKEDEVYHEFKSYSQDKDVEELLKEVKLFSSYYCRIALGREKEPRLAEHFHDIVELKVDVAYPFLMQGYLDYELEVIDLDTYIETIKITESYVFRRAVCDVPTNSMRQTFATIGKKVQRDGNYLESLKAAFLLLQSYRRFPSDEEFQRKIQERDLYNFNRRSYWLRRFENYDRKERVVVNDYTIEYIMPQNENLSSEWKLELGENWESIQEKYLHTLGNLTLTGYNSQYSDKPFAQKRDTKNGFKDSPLRLNRSIGKEVQWNEGAINRRAGALADQAITVWQSPTISKEALEKYKKPREAKASYTIDDHPHLLTGAPAELFTALRKEITSLDACVTEEFLKLYIAYKAETNFADIVPRATGLSIYLNIPIQDIDDPKSIAVDKSNVGTYGNGDTLVTIYRLDEIPYATGLIRQALEAQL